MAKNDGTRLPKRKGTHPMTEFRLGWLKFWCVAIALFGVIMASASFQQTDAPVRLLFHILSGPQPLILDPIMRFSLTLMGAVTLGWSVTLFAAIDAAQKLGSRGTATWNLIAASAVLWFIIDSSISLVTGFPINAMINTVFLVAILWPILTRRDPK
jgi:hypothetical protein